MGRSLLLVAASASFAIAALHIVIIFIGAPGYRYFGAGETIARQAEQGSFFPAGLTFVIAVVFLLFGAYALSGAGVIARLPLLKIGLVVIGLIYTLRGLAVLAQARYLIEHRMPLLRRELVFSAVSLIVGLIYLVATSLSWKSFGKRQELAG